jgi:hypothetical protein
MGRFREQMMQVISDKVGNGMPLDKAYRHLRRGLKESAELWERGADVKRETYAGRIDAVVAREIEFLDNLAVDERERAADVEALQQEGWHP